MSFCRCYKIFERSRHRWCSVGTDTNTWFPQNFQVFQIKGIKVSYCLELLYNKNFFGGGGVVVSSQMPTHVLCQEWQTRQLASWIWILVSWHTFLDIRCLSFLNKLYLQRTGSFSFLLYCVTKNRFDNLMTGEQNK